MVAALFANACVFFPSTPVCIGSMNATACYFENSMAQESTEIARGLRRRGSRPARPADRAVPASPSPLSRVLDRPPRFGGRPLPGNVDPRARTRAPVQRQVRIQHMALRGGAQPGDRSYAPQAARQPRRLAE